ncbi:hypothetical protein SAMN05421505_11713 [Sinosporangium album]|uniref:DUF4190 domain-containing protein n=1 Tax=Sinosporangium album TaxID=504805 RepID=A0A1G8CWL9_9ACTN|nr:hypothetical protein [Sinosporangium album]SDH49832.1 hypothetical protein SAMN05421505_11713 [Sinosporangium album]
MTTPVQIPTGPRPAEETGRRALLLSLAALALTFALPLAGVAMALLALGAASRARTALRAAGKPKTTALAGFTISVVALVLSASATLFQVYFGDQLLAYSECLKGAGTISAQQQCFSQFEAAMKAKSPFDIQWALRSLAP